MLLVFLKEAFYAFQPVGDVGIGFGKLMASLNKTFNWNKAISDAVGGYETLETVSFIITTFCYLAPLI